MIDDIYTECVELLNSRGVKLEDIAECVIFLQKKYHENLDLKKSLEAIDEVLHNFDICQSVILGIELDILAENDKLKSKTITKAMMLDNGLFGVDEHMGLGMTFNYGPIAITNFGYIDKVKPGIINKLNNPENNICNTFIDDIVGAIAACAASILAHEARN